MKFNKALFRLLTIPALAGGAYLVAVMPRMTKRPSRKPFVSRLYAHRGLHDNNSDAPENSMKAFRKAVEAGYGIECDVQLSRDGIPVIFHDSTLARVARYDKGYESHFAVRNLDGSKGVRGKISDYSYDELQHFHLMDSEEKIPKLEDFLDMVDGRVPLIIEIKIDMVDTGVCAVADGLLRKYKGPYCIESFNPLALLWYKKHHPQVMRGQLAEEFLKDDELDLHSRIWKVPSNLMLNFLTKPDFVAYNYKHANNFSRRIVRKLYRNVSAGWTIKDQKALDENRNKFDIFIFDSFIPDSDDKFDEFQDEGNIEREYTALRS
ncbi:glycerophosphodiester phosphodiesterase family protein [Butyrivibrio sp. MC2013]|uniref:glycerophosphodiester phosphodiesterase family protein n=1 Tax=Butyrivibrio sp. MC2013 TaxID=1280686 RepID=UPI0012DD5214|nr:glycerophosphodiester phosphodiesterase family protein [Butyrivibrio sp. MC2013]